MKTSRILIAAALSVALFGSTALAQSGTPTLRVDVGSAMVSNGGEFVTAPSGTPVPAGSRVMLAEGSRATLVYPNGCAQPLGAAGVFSVAATCVASTATGSATAANVAGTTAAADVAGLGIIAGVAAAGAVALDNMDEVPYEEPPPVSR